MNTTKDTKAKVANALLRRRDHQRRRRMILANSVVLLLLFLAHDYFSNLASPLKLMPQTGIAIAMGYVILYIISLSQFKYVAEFIDWTKVIDIAGPTGSRPAASVDNSRAPDGPPSVS